MQVRYYPEVDMLNIDLSTAPGADAEEVSEGFLFTYNEEGLVVGIEVDQASKRVDLEEIDRNDAYIVTMGEIFTVSTVAAELDVGGTLSPKNDPGDAPGQRRSRSARESPAIPFC